MDSLLDTLRQTRAAAEVEANQLGFLGAFFDSMPFPCWIKSIQPAGDLRMARVNRAFEARVGIPSANYFARTDQEVWGDQIAAEMARTDHEVVRAGVAVEFNLILPDPSSGERYRWSGVKWPIYHRGGITGVAGMATRGEQV